jgi:hypothetical protein
MKIVRYMTGWAIRERVMLFWLKYLKDSDGSVRMFDSSSEARQHLRWIEDRKADLRTGY